MPEHICRQWRKNEKKGEIEDYGKGMIFEGSAGTICWRRQEKVDWRFWVGQGEGPSLL